MKQKENPFPGPVPIKRLRDAEGRDIQNLFGRNSDVDQICKLLIAERIVLLYSPSGAGKTSLIQAGLLPRMENEDFAPFPIFRLDRTMPDGTVAEAEFVRNLLATINLDPTLADKKGGFTKAVQAHCQKFEKDTVLVLDQFEQLLTADPRFQNAVTYFFQEIGAALTAKKLGLWALISIREDLIALLDSYLQYFPNALRARYRLNYLTPDGAQMAIEEPARKGGAPFALGAATLFVDNLRAIAEQNDKPAKELERYVDPFQLQVACLDLWNNLSDSTEMIQKQQIPSAANITDSLANYISSQVEPSAKLARIEENVVRDWFERSLIDSRGFRIQTASGPANDTFKNEVLLKSLQDGYLIQSVHRGERTWYELTHDRLVEAVRASNRIWRIDHLDRFAKRVLEWENGKSTYLLYRGKDFKEVKRWIEQTQRQLTPAEDLFWKACVNDHRSLQLKASIRNLIIFAFILLVGLIFAALVFRKQRDHGESRKLAVVASSDTDNDPEASILLGLIAVEDDRRRVYGIYPFFHPHAIESETKYALNRGLQQSRLKLRIAASSISGRGPIGELHQVAFAPVESKDLVVADVQGNLAVVNGITGEILEQRHNIDQKVRTALIGPVVVFSGNLIAAAGDSPSHITMIDWRNKSEWQCKVPGSGEGEIYGLAFDPSGERVAAATSSGISVWQIALPSSAKGSALGGSCVSSAPEPRRLKPDSRATAVGFLHDGRLVSAYQDSDGSVYLWDKDLSHAQRLTKLGSVLVKSITVSGTPDNRHNWIGFATSGGPLIFDLDSKQLFVFPKKQENSINAIAFSNDGHLFATAADQGSVNLWTTTQLGLTDVQPVKGASDYPPRYISNDPILSTFSTSSAVHSLSFSADSELLAAAGGKDAVRVWNVMALRSEPEGASFKLSPDGKFLGTIRHSQGSAEVVIRDVVNDMESLPLGCTFCQDIAFSQNGARFAVSGGGLKDTTDPQDIKRGVQVYGIQGMLAISNFNEWYAYESSLSADGTILATLGVEGIHVWNTVQGTPLAREKYKYEPVESGSSRTTGANVRSWSPVSAIALAANKAYLAAGSQNGTVTVWSLPASSSPNDPRGATHEPDPRRITLGQVRGNVAVSGLLFGDEATHLLGSARNADLLAVADVGGKVTIWDVSSGRKRWELPVTFPSVQGRTPIHSMAFSLTATSDKSAFRRQRRLQSFAVASDDGVKLWRLGEKPTRETLYSAPIYSLAFALAPEDNGDSKRLEGVDRNGRLLTWIVDDQTIEDEARQRVTKSIQDYECVVYLGKACPGELNDLDHFVEGRALARAGKEKEAIALLSQAAGDGFLNHKTAKQTYNEFRAAALRESARDEQGDLTVQERADHLAHVKSAMEEYKEAFKLDPTVPTTIAIADIAESLASFGKIEDAIEAYNTADELDRTFFDNRANSRYPNNICWSAAMARVDFAKLKKVLPLCEQAVTLEHNAPGPRDSRGIVRALTGDIRGALDDETAFMNWTGKQWDQDRRRDWINCIQIQGPSHAEVCNATLIDALRHRYGAPPR